jgi:hypothetical protein
MTARVPIPEEIQHRILDRSRRRCALCIHFNNDWQQKEGQLAHLDRDPANCAEDNLAFFCLPHHDDYDTNRRQTKSLTIREAKTARNRLYAFIETGGNLATAGHQLMRGSALETASDPSTPRPASFPRAQPKDGPARFRAPSKALGVRDNAGFLDAGGNNIYLAPGPAMWLRLMPPHDTGKRWKSYDLKTVLGHGLALQPFLWGSVYGYGGFYTLRAEDGIGSCALLSQDARETGSVAFAFQTGEVWAIDTWLLAAAPADLVIVDIERIFTQRLQEYAAFLTHLGLQPPYHWIAGLTGIKDRRLQRPPPPGQMRVPGWPGAQCLSETVQKEGEYDSQHEPGSVLIRFFEAIFDACGVPRPDYLSS